MWMAPCAKSFKEDVASAQPVGSRIVFHDEVDPKFFDGSSVPDRATTIVVSAQLVSREFLSRWRSVLKDEKLMLVRRGTSLGSIDVDAATEFGISVVNTPGINSPHVAKFVVETLGLNVPQADPAAAKAVVLGAGSVGQFVVELMSSVGIQPTVVNRSPQSPKLEAALQGATHVAVCASTCSEPIITATHIRDLIKGEERAIKICSVSRPEAFSLDAIMMIAQQGKPVQLHFDYGQSILAPTQEKVNQGGVKDNVTWSSLAMASEACKMDMDEAVLRILAKC